MVYEEFLTIVTDALQNRLGKDYGVIIQKVPKNNGTLLDGLNIAKVSDHLAPTIYLNGYYEQFKDGMPLEKVLDEILSLYTQHSELPVIDPEILSHFDLLRDKVVYKLIHTKSNETLLQTIPSIPYLDLSIVFYLFLEENQYGRMTALIHNQHMASWNTSLDELYELACHNTPLLLPPDLKGLREVMRELGEFPPESDDKETRLEDLSILEDSSPFYVLTNQSGAYGSCAILYDDLLKNFADLLAQDLVILPSSIHEVLLLPHTEDVCFEELAAMVRHINRTEVPTEDRLSNQIYYFSRSENLVSPISISPEYQTS